MSKNCCVFRYPGGKVQLSKQIIPLFTSACPSIDLSKSFRYLEPFVGGGGMLINVAKTYPYAPLFINDLDENMYSFWKIICDADDTQFNALKEELRVIPTVDYFFELRKCKPTIDLDKAYLAVFFNKTTFSGMYKAGPIGGANQTGKWKIDCYFKPPLLLKRMDNLRSLLVGRTTVTNLHFRDFIGQHMNGSDYVCYLDPPYYVQGSKLYPTFMNKEEHEELALLLKNTKNWILSYDCCDSIDSLYSEFIKTPVKMTKHMNIGKSNKCATTKEYVIFNKIS